MALRDARSAAEQIKEIKIGEDTFTLKPVLVPAIDPSKVYTFLYKAEKAGTTGRRGLGNGMYDSNPLIVVAGMDKATITGFNVHYTAQGGGRDNLARIIQEGGEIPQTIAKRLIHSYRWDRIITDIYEVEDAVAEYKITHSKGKWMLASK